MKTFNYSEINLHTMPDYIKNKKIPRGGCWNDKTKLSFNQMYTETNNILQKIAESGGPQHFMESPARFITEYNDFCNRLRRRIKFRQKIANWWVKKQFLKMYDEVKYRPGNSGYQIAKSNFLEISKNG